MQQQNIIFENCFLKHPNPEIIFTQTTDPTDESKPHFRKYFNSLHKPNHSASNCFRKQLEHRGRKPNFDSRSKSPLVSFIQ